MTILDRRDTVVIFFFARDLRNQRKKPEIPVDLSTPRPALRSVR